MGTKITGRTVVRATCVIVVILTLFFDYLYLDKMVSNWWLYSSNPELISLTVIGLVGYVTLNLLVVIGVKWSWS